MVFLGLGLGWWLYGNKSPKPEEAGRSRKSRAVALGRAARPPLCGRVLRCHRDCLLRVVGARDGLARPPRVGRHRGPGRVALRPLGAAQPPARRLLGRWRLRQNLRRAFHAAAACWRACRAAACKTTFAFWLWPSWPWPQFFSGAAGHERNWRISDSDATHRAAAYRRGHCALLRARTRAPLRYSPRSSASSSSLFIWTRLPADGSIGLVERAAWAPSLGIEYHLGVDGLGALMLVLSAIVTLMSVDAAHRVHHMPGLFFGLVLMLEAGLFGSFTALNFFHWFLFWELSLIPAFFLIKLWGGPRRGPAATQFFIYTMAGSVALLLCFLAIFLSTGTMDFGQLTAMAQIRRAGAGCHGSPWSGHAMACHRRASPASPSKCPSCPSTPGCPRPTPRRLRRSPCCSPAPCRRWASTACCASRCRSSAARSRRSARRCWCSPSPPSCMGAWAAAAQKDLKRVFAYSSVNHLGYCLLGIFALAIPVIRRSGASQSGCCAQRRHSADVQPRHYRGRALLVHRA